MIFQQIDALLEEFEAQRATESKHLDLARCRCASAKRLRFVAHMLGAAPSENVLHENFNSGGTTQKGHPRGTAVRTLEFVYPMQAPRLSGIRRGPNRDEVLVTP